MKYAYPSGLLVLVVLQSGLSAEVHCFNNIFPLTSYKRVVDTCMRVYSDLLILEEKDTSYDRCDDLIDIMVGRLVRLQSYVTQIIHEYHTARTIGIEDLEYLARILEYMHITSDQLVGKSMPVAFNKCIESIKRDLYMVLHADDSSRCDT